MRFESKYFLRSAALTAAASALLVAGPSVLAQAAPSTVHGHVVNPAGQPVANGQIKFTKDVSQPYDSEKFTNTVNTDDQGNYSATGITPGNYFVWVVQGGKTVDRQQLTVKAAGGENDTLDFDMTRAEYINAMSPEERKALEEYKSKNAAAVANNKAVTNLNTTLTTVRADLHSPTPNYDKDITDTKAAVDQRPTEPLLWEVYADSLVGKANAAANEDRKNKTNPSSDDAVNKGYADGVDAYKKAIDLMDSGGKPNPQIEATVYSEMGGALANGGKSADATTAYDKAATILPANAGSFYNSEAAIFFNSHQDEPALAAADKAISADPSKPLPYYIKGQELLTKATVDKTGKIVPPPGCLEAYNKYLELAPDGPQAPGVRDTLTALGQKVETHYSASKKGH